ncbi:MAG: cell division protein FtsQ/DivIB [Pseudomonadota bacterium]
MAGTGHKTTGVAGGTRSLVTRLVLLAVCAGVLAVSADWLWQRVRAPDFLPLNRIVVKGSFQHLSRDELETAVARAATGGYFSVDVEAVRRVVLKLPWVEQAAVRRVWPDALVLRVEEQRPFARWGESAFVNARGEIFQPTRTTVLASLPLLEGPGDSGARVVQRYRELAPRFASAGQQLAALKLDERGAWSLTLRDGLQVVLGSNRVETRLRRVEQFLNHYEQQVTAMQQVDARYPSGVAVQWKTGAVENGGEPDTSGGERRPYRDVGNARSRRERERRTYRDVGNARSRRERERRT